MILSCVGGLFLQLEVWDLVQSSGPLPKAVMVILLCFSLASWAVILSKWASFRRCALRQPIVSAGLPQSAGARHHCRRQRTIPPLAAGGGLRLRIQRSGAPDEIARQRHQSAVARAYSATGNERRAHAPGAQYEHAGNHRRRLAVHRIVRHGVGHYRRVSAIGHRGRRQPRAVAPGISEALITTAMGLFAAIPAYIFYNIFGSAIKEFAARMEDFHARVSEPH